MNYKNYLNDTNPRVLIDVEGYGKMEVELFPSVAPITVENFLKLVDSSFYDGIIFHRVISGFMIQGGDPLGNGTGGSREKIKGEFASNGVKNDLEHTKGVISMARTQVPNSASSQFFIMHADSDYLDGEYAAFGAVVSGIEVVDKIASVKTGRYDDPVTPVKMNSIRRTR
jgi:peptidyl-prolyl cis-trans isomerase B (cyclophilin B)